MVEGGDLLARLAAVREEKIALKPQEKAHKSLVMNSLSYLCRALRNQRQIQDRNRHCIGVSFINEW